jgi:hypothetical protein
MKCDPVTMAFLTIGCLLFEHHGVHAVRGSTTDKNRMLKHKSPKKGEPTEAKMCVYENKVDAFLYYAPKKGDMKTIGTPKPFDPALFSKLDYTYTYDPEPTDREAGCFYCDDDKTSMKDGSVKVESGALAAWMTGPVPTPNVINIDMGQYSRIGEFTVTIASRDYWGLFAPGTVTVSFSEDGVTYFGEETFTPAQVTGGDFLQTLQTTKNDSSSCKCSLTTQARYARVMFTCLAAASGKCTIGEIDIIGQAIV